MTIHELKKLESAPKTKAQRTRERLISFLPLVLLLVAVAEYKLVPTVEKYARNSIAYPVSDCWTGLLIVADAAVFVWTALSFFKERVYEKLLAKAPLWSAIIVLAIMYDVATLKTGALQLPYFPWPDRVLLAIVGDRSILLDCVANSLLLLFTGYFVGTAAGLITGIAAGWNRRVFYWVSPLLKVLGPIPAVTWISIILVVASSLFGGSVFMIALGVWYPVTMSALQGIANVPRANFEAARTFGLKAAGLVFKVAVPAALPSIFTGLTQGMSVACTALMVAEMLGVESGLGWYINWQRGWAEFAKMYAAVIIICLTFTAVNFVLARVKKRSLAYLETNS
jgi:NitT/TauT family transport system permease protein